VLSAPALGGSAADFEQALGGPNDATIGPLLHLQRCAGSDVDQFILLAPGDQVWTIQRAWCGLGSRSAEERFNDAAQYVPADATPDAPFTSNANEPGQTYVSATLAAVLPAGLFHDCLGNAVTPGTLFVVADSFGGWFMGPGTCPGG